jgi:beta-lactamase superfamily II metal-dependent hydrolase
MKPWVLALVLAALSAVGGAAATTLDMYFIDVEGGQATLIVTPKGQSILIDAGYGALGNRDPKRIMEAVRDAGITHIDYQVITHFHGDHVGGVPEIAQRIPIHTFVDYGEPREPGAFVVEPYAAYAQARKAGRHLMPKPGDWIPLEDVEVEVLSAGGATLSKPLAGAGQPNPACASFEKHADDPSENHRSIGVRVKFGAFRFLDLGDLNWNPLGRLVCPNNLIGQADLYLVPHHSGSDSNVPALLAALRPRVVMSNNGASKGGAADAFATLHHLEGVEDVWQLHRSLAQGAENSAEPLIANLDEGATGFWIKVSASRDGSFTVTNARNGITKTYTKR